MLSTAEILYQKIRLRVKIWHETTPKGVRKSQQESITQVNKTQKQRFKNRKDEQEQRKHFMDNKDSNRYRFKSSRVARNATE